METSLTKNHISTIFIVLASLVYGNIRLVAQPIFPNPATLSTGQGADGANDPLWSVSTVWYPNLPVPNPMTVNYTSAMINYSCSSAWQDPTALQAPVNNGRWITGPEANCNNNTAAGYRFFRLPINLPPDCNGQSVTQQGVYELGFDGYVDNTIAEVYINGNPQGISGGGFSTGSQLSFTLDGPWVVGINYIDILVYNQPNGGGSNPYGLLLVATDDPTLDSDGDGIPNLDDLCPCTPGNNPYGCVDSSLYDCDKAAIRAAFTGAGYHEFSGCSDDCSMYFLNPNTQTGSAAQNSARALGANLVSIQSAAENQCLLTGLNQLLAQNGYPANQVVWIGFNDEAVEGTFVWYDQAPVTYTNWAPNEPNNSGGNEDCTQIYPAGNHPGRWNDLPCNSGSSMSIIEVNLCPVLNAADVTICEGATANVQVASTLFGSTPYTYAWDNGVSGPANPVSPPDDTSYVVTVTDRYSCTVKDTVNVTVNDLPSVSAGPDQSVCPQEMVTLAGTGANTYTWTGGVTNATPFLPMSTNQTYIVTGTDVNNCVNRDTVNVTVRYTGCPNFPNTYVCNIDSIRSAFTGAGLLEMMTCIGECSMYFLNPQSMSGSQAQAFAQTLGANLVSVQNQAENNCIINSLNTMGQSGVIWIGFNDEAVEGQFVWYDQSPVTYTNWAPGEPNNRNGEDCTQIYADGTWNDLNCGTANAQSIIEVNLCPVVDAGQDVTICAGATANLNAANTILGSHPYSYLWNNGVTTLANPVSPQTTTSYSIRSTDRYECTKEDTVIVNVNQLPLVNAGNDRAICNDAQVTLSGSGAVSYTWNNGAVNGTPFTPPVGVNQYVVTGTDANNCVNTDTVEITVYATPPVDAGADFLVCQGDAVTLTATGAVTYTWNNGVVNGLPFVINSTTTYTVLGTTADGCTATDNITVSVTPTPIVVFAPSADLGCKPLQIVFTNAQLPGVTCLWDFGNGETSTSCGTVSTVYLNDGCYNVTMTATTNNGCVGQTTMNNVVCVAPDPVAAFTVNPTQVSQISPEATFDNNSTGAVNYMWDFGDGNYSNAISPINSYPTMSPGTYPVTLIAISDVGCMDTAYGEVEMLPALTVYTPNSFTPGNGDDINTTFRPIFSSNMDIRDYSLTIYDRWGLVVFRSSEPNYGWNGTFKSTGKLMEGGVYVWKLEYVNLTNLTEQTQTGHVTLLR